MTDTGDTQPPGKGDRIVLGRPYPTGRNRGLEAEPFSPGRAVALPVQPGMVGENLDTGADNERHEKQVEEVQQPEPIRKSRGDGHVGARNAGVAHEKILQCGEFP